MIFQDDVNESMLGLGCSEYQITGTMMSSLAAMLASMRASLMTTGTDFFIISAQFHIIAGRFHETNNV